MAKRDIRGAIDDYCKTIEIDPRHARAYYGRGNAKKAAGDDDGAIADYSKAIEIDPRYADAYTNRGIAKQAKGDLDGAIDDYSNTLEIDSRIARAYYNRGIARNSKGDVADAIDDFTQAIEINPQYVDAYIYRGVAKQTKGDVDGEIADCSKAIEISPRSALAFNNRGIARIVMGDLDGAMADWTTAIEIDARYVMPLANRGRFGAASYGPSREALADLRATVERDASDDTDARFWIWIVRAGLGEERAASDELVTYVAARPAAKSNDWYSMVAGLLSRRLSEVELLRRAKSDDPWKNDEQTCKACFYAGAVRALHRERTSAVLFFDRCIATGANSLIEYDGAIGWRSRLLSGANVKPVPAGAHTSVEIGRAGLIFVDLEPDGPAARAGLQPKDIVVTVDGKSTSPIAWRRMLVAAANGAVLKLGVVRSGKPMEIELRLGRWE
jgi:lipoprotein NlpI